MKIKDLVENLQALGLSDQEALVYLNLRRSGPTTTSAAARAAGISRTRAYEVLRQLVRKRYVTPLSGTPKSYAAIPPEELYQLVLESKERDWERLLNSGKTLVESFHALGTTAPDASEGSARFLPVMGRADAVALAVNVLRAARQEIRLIVAGGPRRLPAPFMDLLELAVRRGLSGVRVHILTDAQVGPLAEKAPDNATVVVRRLSGDQRAVVAVVDGRTCVEFIHLDASPAAKAKEDLAFQTDAPSAVGLRRALFDLFWDQSMDLRRDREDAVRTTSST